MDLLHGAVVEAFVAELKWKCEDNPKCTSFTMSPDDVFEKLENMYAQVQDAVCVEDADEWTEVTYYELIAKIKRMSPGLLTEENGIVYTVAQAEAESGKSTIATKPWNVCEHCKATPEKAFFYWNWMLCESCLWQCKEFCEEP